VNAVAPNPVTNSEFTFALGRVLKRPTIFPLPTFVARGLFGEMADATMLSSARVTSQKLLDAGYKFKYPKLEQALNSILRVSR
jgi:NAD dependent epimerase/dehydratase family enzyme